MSSQREIHASNGSTKNLWPQKSPSRKFLRFGLCFSFALIGIQILLLVTAQRELQRIFVNDLFFLIAAVAGFVGQAYGAYRSIHISRRLRLAWGLVAAGSLSSSIGAGVAFFREIFLQQVSWPSMVDFFYLAAFPPVLAAAFILTIRRISRREMNQFGLDVGIVMLSSMLILWKLVIIPELTAEVPSFIGLMVNLAYLVADLILICTVVMLILRPDPSQPQKPIWIMLGALVFEISGDLLATGSQSAAVVASSDWLNIFYTACPLALMVGGLLQAVYATESEKKVFSPDRSGVSRLGTAFRLALPYPWLAGAYWMIVVEPTSQLVQDHDLLFVWVAVIIGLVLVRQFLALRENRQLSQDLAQLNRDLEKRVGERTAELYQANDELREEMIERERIETVLREREEKLAYNALHDALTGLPNRILMMERIDQALRRLRRQEEENFVLLFLDFDGFKVVNDSLGHLTGDQVLVQIARRMRTIVREIDMVARLGGDEFVILMEDIHSLESVQRATERLMEKLAEPFEINGQQVFLTASIGLVPGDPEYQQPTDILRDADLAMYEAKARGKACYIVFTPALRAQALARLLLENNLRAALERNEFILHYQPILDLTTNRLTGFEALIRWQHPEKGLIPPANFIPVAEASGIILPITQWVMRQACAQMRAWQTELPGGDDLMISINLSPKLFNQPDLPRIVRDVLAETGLEPRRLILEITEGVIVEDSEEIRKILEAWRSQGIQVHVDDFGTGYSSLSYLHRLPIDTLKIDRTFIKQIRKNGDRGEIVKTILTLAREINVPVIAEGIETAEQLSFLKKLGCQSGQGFFISHPLEPGQARELITHQLAGQDLEFPFPENTPD